MKLFFGFAKSIKVKTLSLPFDITPSTPFLSLALEEEDEKNTAGLKFVAWYREQKRYELVRFTFTRLISGKMLGIGGEGPGSPSIGELVGSNWLKEISNYQKNNFPDQPDHFKNLRHFYFQGHDVRVEILAEDFNWTTLEELKNF